MSENLAVTLQENRFFPPSDSFQKKAAFSLEQIRAWRRLGKSDPDRYWAEAALDLEWESRWTKVHDWTPPFSKWFVGGKLNATVSCLDRHLRTQPDRAAIVWEGEPGETVTWTYRQLHREVERLTAGLRSLGLKTGDRIAIYLPLVPEAVAAMLACARGGFPHTVVFGGFSAEALKDRIQDCDARAVITADFGWRKGAKIPLLEQVEKALESCAGVKELVLLKRDQAGRLSAGNASGGSASKKRASKAGPRRSDWHELLSSFSVASLREQGRPVFVDSEHPLFVLYTSGTTGKPKGLVHSTGGYLTGVLRTSRLVFDLQPTDLYWCTADIGWITGHSYVVYGPLAAGASLFLYEGAPMTPAPDRFWAMIERHGVTILYTAPTAIRAFMKVGKEAPQGRDLSSLRLLGTVGEPINPEAWMWYSETIGGGRCPIVDTFWQTETGAIVISPIPSETGTKPGSATLPLPGYEVEVVDKKGEAVPVGEGGYLVIKRPWPSQARTVHGDPERFRSQYFKEFGDQVYFTGDGARRDAEGYFWCLGRVDDVLNVSGHRLGTMEIESALVSHPAVAEAAVVGRPDDLKGQGVVAFVTLKAEFARSLGTEAKALASLSEALRQHVATEIGALARPDEIRLTEGLPKTRSGKIMRRLLRELATSGRVQGDTTTLEDLNVIAALQRGDDE
jgi:acetyl-CoA synthetase